jgi:hypothetical protein
MKIEILKKHGYSCLKFVKLPIIVEAHKAYEGCYEVYGKEFRPYGVNDKMPDSNGGKGLYHSFYSECSFRVINQGDSK